MASNVRCMKRKLALILGIAAYVVPAAWICFGVFKFCEEIDGKNITECGLPFLAIMIFAVISAALLSGLAILVGVLAFHAIPKPRTMIHKFELVLLVMPLVLSVTYIGIVFGI